MNVMLMETWEIDFAGQVQGVGFRFRTRQISQRYEVTGWVENLPNGHVRVVAEGPSNQVCEFVEDIRSTMAGYIRDVEVHKRSKSKASREFSSFEIRR